MKASRIASVLGLAIAAAFPAVSSAQNMTLMTGPQGGVWVPLGGQLKSMWEKAIPGLNITATPGAGIANVRGIDEGKAQIGFGNSSSTVDGLAGAAIAILGLLFETVADWQLVRFKKNPANEGAVMDKGLWRYTRHPNYFGDACVWWGIALVAAETGSGAFGLIGALVMTIFLRRVSGVTSAVSTTIGSSQPRFWRTHCRTWPPLPSGSIQSISSRSKRSRLSPSSASATVAKHL